MAQNPLECMAKLVGLGDPVRDKEVPCAGLIKIGRDQKANTLPIGHASVSRQHAQILNENGAWVVEDLKSTNGVFVNNNRITQKTPLKDGDVVRIGDIPLKFMLVQPMTQVMKGVGAVEADDDMTIQSKPNPHLRRRRLRGSLYMPLPRPRRPVPTHRRHRPSSRRRRRPPSNRLRHHPLSGPRRRRRNRKKVTASFSPQ